MLKNNNCLCAKDLCQFPVTQNESAKSTAPACSYSATYASTSTSMTAVLLAKGVYQICGPAFNTTKDQLKELVDKQNKICTDVVAEKSHFDKEDFHKLCHVMNTVKIYQEKLVKIKHKMDNIYKNTKYLKKRAENLKAHLHKQTQSSEK